MAKEKNSSESIKFVYISKIPKKVSIILKSGSHHKIKHLFFVREKKINEIYYFIQTKMQHFDKSYRTNYTPV